jgi:hypothetical protein
MSEFALHTPLDVELHIIPYKPTITFSLSTTYQITLIPEYAQYCPFSADQKAPS